MKAELAEWCLDPKGWELEGSKKKFDLSKLEDNDENRNKIFYKNTLSLFQLSKMGFYHTICKNSLKKGKINI